MSRKYCVEDALKKIVDGNSSDMGQLGEDDNDDDDEDWTLTGRIEENSGSSDNEEALDETVNQTSAEGQEEDTTKQKDITP